MHMFYTCPKINSYWNEVKNLLDRLLNIQMQPENILLNICPPDLISEADRYLFRILRITALKQITRNWKQQYGPKIENWLSTVKEVHTMEI